MSEPTPDPRQGVSPTPDLPTGVDATRPAALGDAVVPDADNIDVQMVWRQSGREWPDEAAIRSWVAAALPAERQLAELTIRVVDHAEARMLNREYRGRDYATNVLSFPAELPHGVGLDWLGDIVVCGPVVEAEALAQGKSQRAHFAHLVIHGTLHLLGLDHEDDAEATIMEGSECAILARLGYADPYADDEQ